MPAAYVNTRPGYATDGTQLAEWGGSLIVPVSASKQRPNDTTAYTAKDAIAESTSVATVWTFANAARVAGGSGKVVGANLLTDQAANTSAYKLHLYSVAPTALQDNSPCTAPLYADAAKYVGTIVFPAAGTEGAGATAAYSNLTQFTTGGNLPLPFKAVDANLYALLETVGGFTPAMQQNFTVQLLIGQN